MFKCSYVKITSEEELKKVLLIFHVLRIPFIEGLNKYNYKKSIFLYCFEHKVDVYLGSDENVLITANLKKVEVETILSW